MEIPEYVIMLVEHEIPVTIVKDESKEDGIYFDLNLEAKSHLHLYKEKEKWYVSMRYWDYRIINSFDELLLAAKDGMYGMDYVNQEWAELLIENNILTKVVETKVHYN